MKEQLLNNNSLDSEVIKFGIIKLTRIYSDFNSNENNRVIKSFQHSRKKILQRRGLHQSHHNGSGDSCTGAQHGTPRGCSCYVLG